MTAGTGRSGLRPEGRPRDESLGDPVSADPVGNVPEDTEPFDGDKSAEGTGVFSFVSDGVVAVLNRFLPRRFAAVLFCVLFWSGAAFAAPAVKPVPFVPEQPTVPVGALKAGMKGYLLTVLRGTSPVRLPLEVVDVIPQKGEVSRAILIRLLPSPNNRSGGVAEGMSGSPVYIGGRLAGAVGSGWAFSDHNLALVTPIEDMCAVFSRPDNPARPRGGAYSGGTAAPAAPLSVAGLEGSSAERLSGVLGVGVTPTPAGASEELEVAPGRLSPGEAVAALLVLGDVEVGATGTVTATSKDGRFLAFGHPFLGRGAVNFPAARARIHETVYSQAFPFKLGNPVSLVGTMTQDRTAGIGGRTDFFTPSISAALAFTDADQGLRTVRNFRVVPDAFLGSRLLEGVFAGLIDDVWRRKGQGTLTVNLRIDGRGVDNGWARKNVFFSESDVSSAAFREAGRIWELFLLQPFTDGMPVGFRLEVEATEEPRLLFIEDVTVSSDARPGDVLDVGVTLRPWRKRPVRRNFTLTVPKEASGTCELLVRGGGTNSLPQLALEGGWKSIDGLSRMLTEVGAMDANNELILELLCDSDGVKTVKDKEKNRGDDRRDLPELLPEEREFLSETKARRIREGTLRISRSEYFVDGMMKRLITVKGEDGEER